MNHELGLSELNSVYQLPNNLLNILNALSLLAECFQTNFFQKKIPSKVLIVLNF